MFAALLLAGAPGVVFGAIEAQRSYTIASQREATVRSDDAADAAQRLESLVGSAADAARLVSTRREVSLGLEACRQSLRAAVSAETGLIGFGRVDAAGKLICSSGPPDLKLDIGAARWFLAIRGGAPKAASDLTQTPFGAQPGVYIGIPLGSGDSFDGAVFVVLPRHAVEQAAARELRDPRSAIMVYDRSGVPLAGAARGLAQDSAARVAALALSDAEGLVSSDGLIAQRVTSPANSFAVVAVAPQGKQVELGMQAALIVLAPVLVASLSLAVVWLALDWWVLRWFNRLQGMAHDFGAGRYAPAAMSGAPRDIAILADAFDLAVAESRARERDLAAALAANMSLTRELHHRVKNNLQVLASLIGRQQRRAEDSFVRNALSEARARMAPVALVYRFISPPEDLTAIDLEPYLRELTRQLHVALGGDARGVALNVDIEPSVRSADDATNIGLIVAETLITGYANATAPSGARATLAWRADEHGQQQLTVGVQASEPAGGDRQLDQELILEVARQLNAEATFEPPASVRLRLSRGPNATAL